MIGVQVATSAKMDDKKESLPGLTGKAFRKIRIV